MDLRKRQRIRKQEDYERGMIQNAISILDETYTREEVIESLRDFVNSIHTSDSSREGALSSRVHDLDTIIEMVGDDDFSDGLKRVKELASLSRDIRELGPLSRIFKFVALLPKISEAMKFEDRVHEKVFGRNL